jgi:ABC-type transport system substrate-binding protein
MKRLLQSGVGVALLILLVVIGVINTAQLHNLETRVAGLEGGVRVVGPDAPVNVAPVTTATAGTCFNGEQEESDLNDPQNLLEPWHYPPGWPTKITSGGTLRRLIGNDPPGLNLIASNNAADISEIYKYIGSKVAYQSPDDPDHSYPDIATKVTKSADGLTYDVYLRKGVYWHTPAVDMNDPKHAWLVGDHEVTADDFAFNLEMIQNPQVLGRAAPLRGYYEKWKPIEVVDPYHFRVHVTEDEYMHLPQLLDLEPMPRWLYMYDEDGKKFDDATWGQKVNDHWYNQKGIGAGMYRFVSWEPGVSIVLERNPRYHRATCQPANFDRVELKVLKDQQSWLRRLKTRELDYAHMQPQQYLAELKNADGTDKVPYLGEPGLKMATHWESSYFYIGWNEARPMFKDKRVRTAMTLAFDREGLVKSVFGNLGRVVSGPFDTGHPCYDHSVAPLPYDLDRAAALLDEAGWKDTDNDGVRDQMIDGKKVDFAITLLMYTGTEYETLARVYREALQKIGIKLTPQPLEWAAQLKKQNERDFDGYTGAWVPTWDVDLNQIWHSKEADRPESSNYVSFKNPEADRIAETLRRTFEPAARIELCHQFHKLIAEEQPYSFFYQRKRAVLYWDHMNEPVFSKVNPYRDLRLFSFASLPTN